jgi:ABC-2 type transport system permease protein
MRTVWLVLKREIRTRIASKPFLISTVISAAVLIAIVVVIGATAGDGTVTYDLGVVGTRPAAVAAAAQDLAAGDEGAVLDIQQLDDRAEAERLVEAGDLDAALVGDDLVVKVEPDPRLGTLLQAAHREVALGEAVREANVEAPPPLAVAPLEPDDQSEDRGTVAFIGVVLLYAQILGFGYWVASGIVEEKASRVVEILLAKARSSHLLAGKLVGSARWASRSWRSWWRPAWARR